MHAPIKFSRAGALSAVIALSLLSVAAPAHADTPAAPQGAPDATALTVHDLAELTSAIEGLAAGETTIELAEDFAPVGPVANNSAISLPADVQLTLTGAASGTTLTKTPGATGRFFTLRGNGSQTLSITGITFQGPNEADPAGLPGDVPGGGVGVDGVPSVSVAETTISGTASSSALAISGAATVSVTGSSFLGNRSGSSAAISGLHNTIATISDSTFHKNYGWELGYSGGAIRATGTTELTVERSVFSANESATRGGAIAFHQMGGTLNVHDSVFDGNVVQSNGNTLNDGGAIAVNERPIAGPQAGKTFISGTTFANNRSGDEGGAILAQSGDSTSFVVHNSTFFNNVAAGMQERDASSAGGAIEAFGTPLTLLNNTFVNNIGERGKLFLGVAQAGGAVSAAGDSAHLKRAPVYASHNLFVGNDVLAANGSSATSSAYRQIAAADLRTPSGDGDPRELNVGIDAGKAIDLGKINRAAVLGTDTPSLEANGSSIVAGDPRTGYSQTPGTILFHPGDGDLLTGIADGIGAAPGGLLTDQRGFPMDEPADAGAVQQAFVRFDPNGGDWDYADHPFDGERIVLRANTSEVPDAKGTGGEGADADGTAPALVWAVGHVGQTVTTEPAPTTVPEHGTFVGWNTEPDGSGTAVEPGSTVIPAGNLRLYAQWDINVPVADGTVTVNYVDTDGQLLRDPITLTGPVDADYTTEQLTFDGYDFTAVTGNTTGTYTEAPQTVTYTYTRAGTVGPTDPPVTPTDPPVAPTDPPTTPKGGDKLGETGSPGWIALAGGALALLLAGGTVLLVRRRASA